MEVKFSKVNALKIVLRPAPLDQLKQAISKRFGKSPGMYQGEVAAIALEDWQAEQFEEYGFDLGAIVKVTQQAGLQVVEIQSDHEPLEDIAQELGLRFEAPATSEDATDDTPSTATEAESGETAKPSEADSDSPVAQPEAADDTAPAREAAAPPPPIAHAVNTMVVKQSVRSGQRIYAQGADLIVVGQVSAGAEVIADGNVHVYGVLRGRALAGANGNTQAKIISTCFEAELVSIAGFYLTFEAGHGPGVKTQPALIELSQSEPPKVCVNPLNIR